MVSSVNKFSNNNEKASTDTFLGAQSINSYFSGCGNIAIGIDAYQKYSDISGFNYATNDLFQNIPFLSKYTIDEYKTTRVFNKEIYGSTYAADQIVPITIAGLFHFGYFFSVFYGFIFLIAGFFFERKARITKLIGLRYIYYLLAINCGLFMMINIGSLFSNIIIHVLLSIIPFYFLHVVSSYKPLDAQKIFKKRIS